CCSFSIFAVSHSPLTSRFSLLSLHDALPIFSTLSQSPMLGFHKQMDNRIKLLEEILSFRMQGVEFYNGDMYVDGHKAASDVRDEDRKSGSAGMPRPISYAVVCLKKKKERRHR